MMGIESLWLPSLVTVLVLAVIYLATRPRNWYYRLMFRLVLYRTMLFGPLHPVFPPESKPSSRQSLAFASIFAQFPKSKTAKPALERRAAFEGLGALQSVNRLVRFGAPLRVALLATPDLPTSRTHTLVHPIYPAVSIHGKILLYLHAGTYISGSLNSHRGIVSQLAEHTHRRTYFVEYCLGPEAPVPNCVLDVVSTYYWLLDDQQVQPSNIVIAGDSAGGGLAFLAMAELKKRDLPLPAGIWAMSPWTDLSCTLSSWKTHLKSDVMLNPFDFQPGSACLADATGIVNSTVAQLQSPTISPLFIEDVTYFPPCLIQVGGAECLLSDSVEMHKKLVLSGVKSTLQVCDHQQHIFQLFYDWIPESRQAIASGAKWISKLDIDSTHSIKGSRK